MNRALSYIILLTVILFSCQEPKDYFQSLNHSPQVGLKTVGSYGIQLQEAHKISRGEPFTCIFKYQDDQELSELKVINLSGSGRYHAEDSTFIYYPDTTGLHILELKFLDPYNEATSCKIELDAFYNKPPVALLSYQLTSGLLKVDASESYDQDWEFGGGIVQYKFVLDGIETILSKPVYNQTIDPQLIHIIKLQVQDDDGAWSSLVSDIIPLG